MKISIVTISYNQAEFLEECINSITCQNYYDLEYIIVDPGSTDGSLAIIERLENTIDKVILEPDAGPADGLNKGFNAATGDIFAYINADDILIPGALSYVSNYFEKNRDIDVLCGNGLQLDRNGSKVRTLYSTSWSLKKVAYGAVNAVQQATFFRRQAFIDAGGFNLANRTCWDGELLVDMSLAGARFGLTNKILGGFRIYDGSISGSGRLNIQYQKDNQRIREKILGRPLSKHDSFWSLIYGGYKIIRHPGQSLDKIVTILKNKSLVK